MHVVGELLPEQDQRGFGQKLLCISSPLSAPFGQFRPLLDTPLRLLCSPTGHLKCEATLEDRNRTRPEGWDSRQFQEDPNPEEEQSEFALLTGIY